MIPIDTAVPMIAQNLIERYGPEASTLVANRVALLEACGVRETARCWELVREAIDKFIANSHRHHRRTSIEDLNHLDAVPLTGPNGYEISPQADSGGAGNISVAQCDEYRVSGTVRMRR